MKYLMTVDLEAPEKANRVRAEVLAEMRETERQEKAEQRAQEEAEKPPTTADRLVAALLPETTPRDDCQGFPWAARPTRRA